MTVDSTNSDTFGCWLQKKYLEWAMAQVQPGKIIKSQVEFGKWLGVKQSTLSTWMTGSKTPTDNYVDLLAEKFGMEVYDVLGIPRKMPNDQHLIFFCENWYRLTEEQRLDIYEYVKKKVEGE